jgi:hypothetical protein
MRTRFQGHSWIEHAEEDAVHVVGQISENSISRTFVEKTRRRGRSPCCKTNNNETQSLGNSWIGHTEEDAVHFVGLNQ